MEKPMENVIIDDNRNDMVNGL